MALKPTIYKAQVELADSDRNCFEALALTFAGISGVWFLIGKDVLAALK